MVIERGGLSPNTARFTASRDPAALADRGKGGLKYLYTAATVITLFLGQDLNVRLRPKLLELRPGTRIVSNTFGMGEWQVDAAAVGEGCSGKWCTAMLWIVPAKVAGTWTTPHGEVTLRQRFQALSGHLVAGNRAWPLEGRVRGEEIAFTSRGREYRGRLNGAALELR